jgi:hypothetical protein
MTLSRAFIRGQEGQNRGPPINMDLDDDRVIVLGFETNEHGRLKC